MPGGLVMPPKTTVLFVVTEKYCDPPPKGTVWVPAPATGRWEPRAMTW